MTPEAYKTFTEQLCRNLDADARVIGLVALGSMAAVSRQPDAFSDHDFFVITLPGEQEGFRQDLSWLPNVDQIVLTIRETDHGLKVIDVDAHLLEFAVFDAEEITYAKVNDYRILIDKQDIEDRIKSQVYEAPTVYDPTRDLAMVRALIYVGAGRAHRGEGLSAHAFIKHHLLTHLLALCTHLLQTEDATAPPLDSLDPFRRFEQAYPQLGEELHALLLKPPLQAATDLLDFIDTHIRPRVASYPAEAAQIIAAYVGGVK